MILALLLALTACAPKAPVPTAATEAVAPRRALDPAVQAALEAGAADLDVGVRRRALGTLVAADPAPAGGPWAIRARFDPSEYVRRAAVDALAGRLHEAETRAHLRALVEDDNGDPWSRGAAALVLADGIVDGRVPAAEQADDRARIAAAAAAARGSRAAALLLAATRTGDTTARARLEELLSGGDLPLELWFLRAVGGTGDSGLAKALAAALERAEPEVRLAVATALLDLGDPVGERVLAEALAADEDTALEALDFLAEARSAKAPAMLGGATATPFIKDGAALVRFGLGDGDTRDVVKALTAEESELRLYAARAAGRRLRTDPALDGADRLRAALREGLPTEDPALQLALIEALAGSPSAQDRAALTALLSDESARVRVEAAAALAR